MSDRVNHKTSFGVSLLLIALLLLPTGGLSAQDEDVPSWPGEEQADTSSPEEDEPPSEEPVPETEADSATAEAEEEEGEAARSIVEQWRDTLRFGINSEIIELIPTLRDERVRELEPEIASLLESSRNEELQGEILTYYRELDLPEAQPMAIELLSEYQVSGNQRTQAAIRYLTDLPPDSPEARGEVSELLSEIVRQGGGQIAASAATAVSSYGEEIGVDGITELYDEASSEDVQAALVLSLGEMGDPEAFEFLARIAEDEGEAMVLRQYAVDSLGKLQVEEAIPIISNLLGAENSLLRAYAVSALGRFETEEAENALIAALRDEFWRARVFALQGIARLEVETAIPAVIYKVRQDPEQRVRLEAVKTLRAFPTGEVRSFVEESVKNSRVNQEIRLAMVDLLLHWGDSFSVSLLEEVMLSSWEEEESRILDYIGRQASRIENERFAPLYEKMLSHRNYIIRIYGARGIARNGLARYRENLEELTDEGHHPALRRNAQRALEEL
ncbi:MAG: HEAT repeat domain-containing protein [Spirochaetaceae bacterium]